MATVITKFIVSGTGTVNVPDSVNILKAGNDSSGDMVLWAEASDDPNSVTYDLDVLVLKEGETITQPLSFRGTAKDSNGDLNFIYTA